MDDEHFTKDKLLELNTLANSATRTELTAAIPKLVDEVISLRAENTVALSRYANALLTLGILASKIASFRNSAIPHPITQRGKTILFYREEVEELFLMVDRLEAASKANESNPPVPHSS